MNLRDDTGEIPFWALIAKKVLDWGLAHRLVQADIKAENFGVETEVDVDRGHYRGGRVDVYQNGMIWEVKSEGSAALAAPQAESYLNCKVSRRAEYVKELGPAGAFNGTIDLSSFFGYDYVITYWTPSEGVILYRVDEVKPAKHEATEPVPAKTPARVPSPGGGAFIPIIIPMGGNPQYAYCPDPSCGHGLPGSRADPWTLEAY